MSDNRHFGSAAIALLIIIVFTSAFAVYAVATPLPTPEPGLTEAFRSLAAELTSNLSATGSIQRSSSVDSLALDQNPGMVLDLFPRNLSVTVGDTFVVTATVENVTDLYAWQVYACFDRNVLECLGVSLPFNSIFSNSLTTSGLLKGYNATEFPQVPLQNVQIDEGWVLAGDCLVGTNQTTFNGSGILCQLEFKAVSPGSTTLGLLNDSDHVFQTYILTSDLTIVTSQSAFYSYIYVASN
ncbi:cohesin domain-containing protein [Candidatus Bathyarchaeota archaeon]|nr:cohesin domain-containing protein [Candidatus Bathyarchaeota archaeon]